MHTPTHHLPGRLRLRFSQLKQQIGQLNHLAEALRAIDGVVAVETSPITGGVLVHYENATGNTPAFWNQIETVLLAKQLYLDPRPLGRRSGSYAGDDGGVVRKFAEGIGSALVDKLIQRSAVALVAVLF
jgi:hypothetical protein